jgi:uncharacterized protein (TIGR03435 family)
MGVRIFPTLFIAVTALGQTTPAVVFEAATIRKHIFTGAAGKTFGVVISGGSVGGNRVAAYSVTLNRLISEAFNLKAYQISGGPSWADDEANAAYDIEAKVDGTPTMDQARVMLQALLVDRFHLKVHREMRDLAAYNLVVGKDGPKMKESEPGVLILTTVGLSHIDFGTTSMEGLAQQLYFYAIAERPVFDKTGLTGKYDFRLEWTRDDTKSKVFIPLLERLGLKLEPTTVSTEMVVIDHVEMPSET